MPMMWGPAFEQLGPQRHWRLEMLMKAGCPLVDVPIGNTRSLHCDQWRGRVIARLRAERPRLVVVSMWRGYGASVGWVPDFGHTTARGSTA